MLADAIRIPGALLERPVYSSSRLPQGCIVSYASQRGVRAQRVLVTELLVVHVRRGTKRIHACRDLETVQVDAGRLVVIPPGLCFMSEMVEGEGSLGADYTSTVIALSGDFMAGRSLGARPVEPEGPVAPRVLVPDPYLDAVLRTLPTKLEHATDPRLLELQLEELAVALESTDARPVLAQAALEARADSDARLRSIVARHRGAPIKLDEIAALCGRSVSSFKRDFQRIYGTSPGRWQKEVRLEHAAILLRRHSHTVTQVASMVGFRDTSSFIRAFRTKYGVTPKQLQLREA